MAAGVLLTLAFPPVAAWPVAWVALAPLFVALAREGRPWKAFARGYGFGWALHLVGMDWMGQVGSVPWIVLSFIEATWFGLFALFASVLTTPRIPGWARPVVFAALWTVIEYARHVGRYAFPWFSLAATQVRAPVFLQIISLTGQWGLSFAIALCGGLLGAAFLALWKREWVKAAKFGMASAGVVVLVAAFGVSALREEARLGADAASPPTLAVAQGSVPKADHYSDEYRSDAMGAYLDLTRLAANGIDKPDLVIWPETVVPGYLLQDSSLYAQVTSLARETRTPLLTGTVDISAQDEELNSAVLFDGTGTQRGKYDKKQIVPLGEFFPMRALLGNVYRTYGVPDRDMASGALPGTLTVGGTSTPFRLGVLICYDDVFPVQARERVREGAEILTVLTSDQTFGTTAGPVQHADLAVLRAVETRRWLIRAAATGVSEFIAPDGTIAARLETNRRGVVARRVPRSHEVTLFVRWGDWFVAVCAVMVFVAGGITVYRQKTPDA